MHVLGLVLSTPFIELAALFLSIVWMIRDQTDKVRPLLVIALTVNLFYGILLSIFMGAEGSLLPRKYDAILLRLDQALGIYTGSLAAPLQGAWRVPLGPVHHLWFQRRLGGFLLPTRSRSGHRLG